MSTQKETTMANLLAINTQLLAEMTAKHDALLAQKPIGMLKPCVEGWFADLENPPPLGTHESIPFYLEAGAQPISNGHPDDAGFELWWSEHMPEAVQSVAISAWNAAQPAAVQAQDQRVKSFAETHPANPHAKCKCEHWQSCIECHPTAHGIKEQL